jgi:CDP-glucose 4,6-dehydratase
MNDWMMDSVKGKRVLVTGHTGFKGSWLTLWLKILGAEVIGVALDPEHDNGAFCSMNVSSLCTDIRQDINDMNSIKDIFSRYQPQVVFHLAAQPLVIESYRIPVETFHTNVIGTANVLEACRHTPAVKTIIVITTDKCYENIETGEAYKETDRLGGKDPYSASKASAEMVVHSYRESFFGPGTGTGLATVRAGNVIGGGDWADNRIVPDCIRALLAGRTVEVRNPNAVRPWQYVLEPLRGYLLLASRLMNDPASFSEPWNFGPGVDGSRSVADLVAAVINTWNSGQTAFGQSISQSPNQSITQSINHPITQSPNHPITRSYEAKLLSLDITKAKTCLNWNPLLSINQSIKQTVDWYKAQSAGKNMQDFGIKQIREYQQIVK